VQNIVINMYEKFHNDRLRNDRSLGNRKSDNNKKKKNVRSAWRPVFGFKNKNGYQLSLTIGYIASYIANDTHKLHTYTRSSTAIETAKEQKDAI